MARRADRKLWRTGQNKNEESRINEHARKANLVFLCHEKITKTSGSTHVLLEAE